MTIKKNEFGVAFSVVCRHWCCAPFVETGVVTLTEAECKELNLEDAAKVIFEQYRSEHSTYEEFVVSVRWMNADDYDYPTWSYRGTVSEWERVD